MEPESKDQEFKLDSELVDGLLLVREGLTKAFVKVKVKDLEAGITYDTVEEIVCGWLEKILAIDLIDDRALKDAISHALTDKEPIERRISKGRLSVPGRDGKLILLVKPYTPNFEGEYKLYDKFQKRFDSIQEGQAVARIYPPTMGTDGLDVFGRAITFTPGLPANIIHNETLLERENSSGASYKELVATKSGYLVSSPAKDKATNLYIETVYRINSDVDHQTGSLDFIGGAEIKGSVMKGFQVLCRDDIIVKGDVLDAKLESREGSIKILNNLLGSELEKTSPTSYDFDDFKWLKAHFDIEAKSIDSQGLFAGRNIVIKDNALRCMLSSGSQIVVGKGFYAGKARTVCGMEVASIGNNSGVYTELEFLPLEEAGEEFLKLEARIHRFKAKEESLSLFLGPYVTNPRELMNLSKLHRDKIKDSVKLLEETKQKVTSLENEKLTLKSTAKKTLISRLNVLKEAFPGTVVKREENLYRFDEHKKGPFTLCYIWAEDRFEIRELEGIDCQWAEETKEK